MHEERKKGGWWVRDFGKTQEVKLRACLSPFSPSMAFVDFFLDIRPWAGAGPLSAEIWLRTPALTVGRDEQVAGWGAVMGRVQGAGHARWPGAGQEASCSQRPPG